MRFMWAIIAISPLRIAAGDNDSGRRRQLLDTQEAFMPARVGYIEVKQYQVDLFLACVEFGQVSQLRVAMNLLGAALQ